VVDDSGANTHQDVAVERMVYGECVVICVAGASYSISPTLTLLFVFSCRARIFGCCKRSALSIYKVHRTLSFLFSCVSFFSSIYPSTNSSTLLFFSPPSLPYPIPSSSDFFSFFFFVPPFSLSPLLYPAVPFYPWTTHRPLLQLSILLTVLILT
jgi:hypothetical protein